MAERAGLFAATERIDYIHLNEHTFDWSHWADVEMRRRCVDDAPCKMTDNVLTIAFRLAYHIFVTDLGNCIFMRASSYLSPFTFNVDTPCYQSCWVASTPSECLKCLQNLPGQISMAAALKRIRSATLQDSYLFDASDFGMHAIIIGQPNLHPCRNPHLRIFILLTL
jgi:hypothetical protein